MEFALILPVLMVMLLLIIDVGRLYFGWVAVQNMARIGANYAASYPTASWGPGSDYQAALNSDATTINCDVPTAWPDPSFLDGGSNIGDRVQVSLSCGFHPITPFITAALGSQVDLGASSVFQVKAGLIGGVPVGTAVPTATPTPTPTGTPAMCMVPAFLTMKVNTATTAWASAGFVPSNFTASLGNGNYKVNTESPANSDNTQQDCATFKITVGP